MKRAGHVILYAYAAGMVALAAAGAIAAAWGWLR